MAETTTIDTLPETAIVQLDNLIRQHGFAPVLQAALDLQKVKLAHQACATSISNREAMEHVRFNRTCMSALTGTLAAFASRNPKDEHHG